MRVALKKRYDELRREFEAAKELGRRASDEACQLRCDIAALEKVIRAKEEELANAGWRANALEANYNYYKGRTIGGERMARIFHAMPQESRDLNPSSPKEEGERSNHLCWRQSLPEEHYEH